MTKLYYAPGACSIGIHILLEEIGKPFEAERVNLQKGEQHATSFTQVNPKAKVPTLERDDGSVLTEYPAIAMWLALTNPEKALLPDDVEGKVRTFETLDYAVSTIHMQGFSRVIRPSNFAPTEADQDAVKARGKEIVTKGFDTIAKTLEGRDYVMGDFSIADSAVFYVESWAKRFTIAMPAACEAHFARMMARPSVQRVFKAEGLA